MDRRRFIKTSLCIGCSAAALALCSKKVIDFTALGNNSEDFFPDPLNKEFIYKSKKDLPQSVRLDICTLCQLRCPKCWRVMSIESFKNTYGLGYLKFEDFKKFVDNYYFKKIELSKMGEIFLNPDLDKIIKYAYKKNIELTACGGVNLNTLSDKTAENLVKYQFKHLKVSIDGATPETYSIYRQGGDFNKVIQNIEKINFYKQKYNSKYPRLTYKFILFGHNEHEITLAKILAKKLNMDIKFELNFSPDYSPLRNKKLVQKLTGIENTDDRLSFLYDSYITKKSDFFFCRELFTEPHINWNGDFFGCCFNYNKDYVGNVFKDGLLKILNSKNVIYQKRLLKGLSVPSDINLACYNCLLYDWLTKNNKSLYNYL